MNDRDRELCGFVLEAVANDYENFACIEEQVMKWMDEKHFASSREEIAAALNRAIQEDYVRAYILSPQEPYSQPTDFSFERLDTLWFNVTSKGKEFIDQL